MDDTTGGIHGISEGHFRGSIIENPVLFMIFIIFQGGSHELWLIFVQFFLLAWIFSNSPLLGMMSSIFLYWRHLGIYSQEFDSTIVSLQDDSRTQPTVLQAMLLSLREM